MIYVISKTTCGNYNVRDIQCNANWDCCPYSDYARIPDSMVEDILATCGYCDITLNEDETEVVSFVAREIPKVPEEIVYPVPVVPGEGVDSLVQVITSESGNPNRDNKPIATGFAAVNLGEFNEVSGDNSFACNYVNLVTGNRSFAANEDNKVYGKRSAAFGWKNTIGVNPESTDAPENPEETANIFSCGYQNTLTGRNSFSAGNVNTVKAVNGFAGGKANTLEATAVNGAVFGESNNVSGQGAFAAGGYNNVAGGYTTALGYKNTVSGQQSFAIGAENEVSGANDFVGGYNNDVFGDYGFVVGANNKVAKGIQNAAVFGVKNEVTGGGGCVVNGSSNTLSGVYANAFGSRNVVSGNAAFAAGQWLQATKEGQSVFGRYNSPSDDALFLVGNGTSDTDRKNAFEVHDDHIVVCGKTLSATTIDLINSLTAAEGGEF